MVVGFALVFHSLGSPFIDTSQTPGFRTDLYVSGTTIFTLGLGDVVPHSAVARELIILEAGTGFGFLAVVMGYFPVLYGAFSRREVSISLLDARAGSPPTAAELLRRHSYEGGESALSLLLVEWERWSAELLESHISYPLLCYFRSQHTNQSWISALTAVLDTSALLIAGVQGHEARQAQLTFAMARHAMVDLAQIFSLAPVNDAPDRLPPERYEQLYQTALRERRQESAATVSPFSDCAICARSTRDMPKRSAIICACRCRHGSPTSRTKTTGSPSPNCAPRPRQPTHQTTNRGVRQRARTKHRHPGR